MLVSKTIHAPSIVLLAIDMWATLFDVELVVPVNHVLSNVKSIFIVSSQSGISILFNIILMRRIVAANHFFKRISLLKLQMLKANQIFEHRLASLVLGDKLNELVYDTLEVSICLISDLAITPEINEKLHALSLGETGLTDESKE